ncbi:MAG TPA: hypothetical protein VFR81_23190 [Longimicrobium sp.]|nr:hypothetical protein [Longimicrobium sp.]
MRPIRTALALLFPLAVAACSEAPTGALSPDESSPRLAILLGCVEFNPPPVGTIFGVSAGTPPGSTIFTEAGIPVSVNPFTRPSLAVVYNDMQIDVSPPFPVGAAKRARTKELNVGFDLSALPPVSYVELEWLDQGGAENLTVNGSPVFIGELDAPPATIGGVWTSATFLPVPGGERGKLTLRGPVAKFQVGGQNLWIDRICAYQ